MVMAAATAVDGGEGLDADLIKAGASCYLYRRANRAALSHTRTTEIPDDTNDY
jgi:hypothetical protein